MTAMKKVYIVPYKSFWLTAVYEDDKLAEVYADRAGDTGLLNRIYVGKVKTVVKNIDAAFIEIGGGINGYYKMGDNPCPLFLNNKSGQRRRRHRMQKLSRIWYILKKNIIGLLKKADISHAFPRFTDLWKIMSKEYVRCVMKRL